ncbi:MAG: hypothetical protein Q8K30_02210 [Candidatus Gracilibacteria bacterium]|nr:hypothetical protein [Candidatus Gracilibacteria bacterium]
MKKILKATAKAGPIKLAFTYIELIVVITIITLLSSTGVFYFNDFVKNQELTLKVNTIEDNLKDLDKKIKNNEIFDYEIQLNTSTGSKGYVTYVNNFDIPYNQKIDFNSVNGSGTLSTNGNSSLTGSLKLYKKHKLYTSAVRQGNTNQDFSLLDEPFYKIVGTLTGEVLNDIYINYFDEDNIFLEKNNLLILIAINSESDKTGTGINSIVIKNIGGTKTILGDGNNYNELYLFFENNGKEKFIRIKTSPQSSP